MSGIALKMCAMLQTTARDIWSPVLCGGQECVDEICMGSSLHRFVPACSTMYPVLFCCCRCCYMQACVAFGQQGKHLPAMTTPPPLQPPGLYNKCIPGPLLSAFKHLYLPTRKETQQHFPSFCTNTRFLFLLNETLIALFCTW